MILEKPWAFNFQTLNSRYKGRVLFSEISGLCFITLIRQGEVISSPIFFTSNYRCIILFYWYIIRWWSWQLLKKITFNLVEARVEFLMLDQKNPNRELTLSWIWTYHLPKNCPRSITFACGFLKGSIRPEWLPWGSGFRCCMTGCIRFQRSAWIRRLLHQISLRTESPKWKKKTVALEHA